MTDETTHLRALLADEHAKRCAAELDHAGAEAERDAILADFSRELDEARKQITDSVMEWARKSGCVYCGEVFDTLGPDGASDARRALYTAHTEVCSSHPLRHVERERDAAKNELAAIADAMHGPTLQPLAQRVRGYVETCDRLNATIGALTTWTHEYGAALKPPGADTYGEGKRDAKNEVAAILRGAK